MPARAVFGNSSVVSAALARASAHSRCARRRFRRAWVLSRDAQTTRWRCASLVACGPPAACQAGRVHRFVILHTDSMVGNARLRSVAAVFPRRLPVFACRAILPGSAKNMNYQQNYCHVINRAWSCRGFGLRTLPSGQTPCGELGGDFGEAGAQRHRPPTSTPGCWRQLLPVSQPGLARSEPNATPVAQRSDAGTARALRTVHSVHRGAHGNPTINHVLALEVPVGFRASLART